MSLNRMHCGGALRDSEEEEGGEERGHYLVEFLDILRIKLPLIHQTPLRGVQILYTQIYGESEVKNSQATLPTV